MGLRPYRSCIKCLRRQARSEFTAPQRRSSGVCATCRRAARKQHPSVPRHERQKLFDIAGGHCSYCDERLSQSARWDADHVIPRRLGGSHTLNNLVASCSRCNCIILAELVIDISFYNAWKAGRFAGPGSLFLRTFHQIEALHLRTGATYWERRAFVQLVARRPRTTAMTAKSTYSVVRARIAHLSPRARGRPRPSTCDPT
jgi:hypothetical protein